REFLPGYVVHAHAARMEGEALRSDARTRVQHGRNFGFHRGVRARYDLADAIHASFHNPLLHHTLLPITDIVSSCFKSAAIAAFNAGLSSLPTRVSGNDSTTSMRSGHLNLASPLAIRNSANSR